MPDKHTSGPGTNLRLKRTEEGLDSKKAETSGGRLRGGAAMRRRQRQTSIVEGKIGDRRKINQQERTGRESRKKTRPAFRAGNTRMLVPAKSLIRRDVVVMAVAR